MKEKKKIRKIEHASGEYAQEDNRQRECFGKKYQPDCTKGCDVYAECKKKTELARSDMAKILENRIERKLSQYCILINTITARQLTKFDYSIIISIGDLNAEISDVAFVLNTAESDFNIHFVNRYIEF